MRHSNFLKKEKEIKGVLEKLLAGEAGSKISTPMNSKCQAAVLIPVYDETPQMLLRPLLSLARQEGIQPEQFEIIVIVNNSRQEAEEKTPAFLANQKILKFLPACQKGKHQKIFGAHKEAIAEIRHSGIIIHAIDKSSLKNADAENYVTHARNRGALELALRFLSTPQKFTGIMATSDADCRFSPNYISIITSVLKKYKLNGLAGALEPESDFDLLYPAAIKKAFELHWGASGRHSPAGRLGKKILLKKRHRYPHQLLISGQDIVVPIKTWLKTGGMPNRASSSDYHFGRLVESLPGDVGQSDEYTVQTLTRVSERAGLGCFGRRVKRIANFVGAYAQGKSDKIYVPDLQKQKLFMNALIQKASSKQLTGEMVGALAREHGCLPHPHSPVKLGELAEILKKEVDRPEDARNFLQTEQWLLLNFYDYLPVKDVTRQVAHFL